MGRQVIIRNQAGDERQIDEANFSRIEKVDHTFKIVSLHNGAPYKPETATSAAKPTTKPRNRSKATPKKVQQVVPPPAPALSTPDADSTEPTAKDE